MLDIKYIKESTEEVIRRLAKKGKDAREEIEEIVSLDKERRELIAKTEAIKAEQNKTNKLIPQYKKEGKDVSEIFAKMKEMGNETKAIDEKLKEIEAKLNNLLLGLPNLPDEDLKEGGKENNEPLRYFGEPKNFDFEPKNHVDLCTDLGLIDYDRGTKLSGSGFWIYRGMGARLEWALLNYFIDTHIADGYELILPPHMLEYECGVTAGQFPKFADEVFKIENNTDSRMRYMLPTAEAALASLYRGEILTEADLPKKLVSYTPCFRREAGSYRSDERGMVRGHQFNKVEMFQYTLPEKSDEAFEELVTKAENLVRDYDSKLRMSGLDLTTYFKYTGQTLESLREQFMPNAQRQVKTRLALEKVYELEGIDATDDEIEAEYGNLATAYGLDVDKVKQFVEPDAIKADLCVKKAVDFVKANAVIKA